MPRASALRIALCSLLAWLVAYDRLATASGCVNVPDGGMERAALMLGRWPAPPLRETARAVHVYVSVQRLLAPDHLGDRAE